MATFKLLVNVIFHKVIITVTTITMVCTSVGAVSIIRHALTNNCQDPRQFCQNIAPYTCCSFPDAGAESIEFAQVLLNYVMMGFQPDIRGTDMCKYLDKWAVGDGQGQRFCMTSHSLTGGMWRPSLPPPPAPTSRSPSREEFEEPAGHNENNIDPTPYPWSHCKYIVNATDVDIRTYETEINVEGSYMKFLT
ncbi:hypothetical protein Mapa_016183 [Marchantia paleacea]|nr:hypothetical protein Mapa_016183 [Marchantia paleacea]